MLSFDMRYIQIDSNGRYRYRRGIPERLRPLFGGKREFIKVLGKTEDEALRSYAKVDTHFDSKLKAAKAIMPSGNMEKSISALRLTEALDALGVSTSKPMTDDEERYRDSIADQIIASLNQNLDTGEFINVPEHKAALIKTLHHGLDSANLTLADAFAYYLAVKTKKDPEERRRQLTRFKYAERIVDETIGLDKPIAGLSRQNARRVTNHLLEAGKATETVRRYLTDIRSVINLAILEHDLSTVNPFAKIVLPDAGTSKRDRRISMPEPLITSMLQELRAKTKKDPFLIFATLYLTGARLAEITGLKCGDLFLEDNVPHIWIRPNDVRRLKNGWSERRIPVCPKTQKLLKEANQSVSDGNHLFPRYTKGRGADRASAWLMKVLRTQTTDKRISIHSLRHNFRDRIRIHGIPLEQGRALEGHKFSEGEEANYGYTTDRWLAVLQKSIMKVNEDLFHNI